MKKNLCKLVALLCLMSVALSGCAGEKEKALKKDRFFRGSELVSYSLIMEGDSDLDISFPVITNKAIKEMELLSADFSSGTSLDVVLTSPNFEEEIKYKKCFAYMPIFTITNKPSEAIDTKLTAVHMKIDGELVDISFDDFSIVNDKALEERFHADTGRRALLIDGEYTLLWPKIPNGDGLGGRFFELELSAEDSLELKAINILGNHVRLDKFWVNGGETDTSSISHKAASENIMLKGVLAYVKPENSEKIVRDSYVIEYECEGKTCLFTVNSGLYIWDDYAELYDKEVEGPIKRFINSLQ